MVKKQCTFFGILFLVFAFAHTNAQQLYTDTTNTNKLSIAQNFISLLNDENIASDVILNQQIRISQPLTNDYLEYLIASLDEVRLNIQSKDNSKIEYIPYRSMSRREVSDIDLEGLSPDDIYFLKFKNKLIVALLIENNKIASFTLVSKGNNMAHFVKY